MDSVKTCEVLVGSRAGLLKELYRLYPARMREKTSLYKNGDVYFTDKPGSFEKQIDQLPELVAKGGICKYGPLFFLKVTSTSKEDMATISLEFVSRRVEVCS